MLDKFNNFRYNHQKERKFMPTLLNLDGFKFFFYANEHEPKHVHVMKDDDFAKINLEDFEVAKSYLKPKDLKFALKIVKENKNEFERIWNEWFN